MAKKKETAPDVEYEVHVGGSEIETFVSKKKAQKYVREQMADGRDIDIYSFRKLSVERFVR